MEMLDVIPRLQVFARSSPEDKKILVEKLRSLGEIVGVTGDGTNDGLAMKTADDISYTRCVFERSWLGTATAMGLALRPRAYRPLKSEPTFFL